MYLFLFWYRVCIETVELYDCVCVWQHGYVTLEPALDVFFFRYKLQKTGFQCHSNSSKCHLSWLGGSEVWTRKTDHFESPMVKFLNTPKNACTKAHQYLDSTSSFQTVLSASSFSFLFSEPGTLSFALFHFFQRPWLSRASTSGLQPDRDNIWFFIVWNYLEMFRHQLVDHVSSSVKEAHSHNSIGT